MFQQRLSSPHWISRARHAQEVFFLVFSDAERLSFLQKFISPTIKQMPEKRETKNLLMRVFYGPRSEEALARLGAK